MRKGAVAVLIVALAAAAARLARRGAGPAEEKAASERPRVLYYRAPMDPRVTSPVPKKDSMGMDFIPVYAEAPSTETVAGRAPVSVSPYQEQLANVRTETVESRELVRTIVAYARVAYDPELYGAQQEYLSALDLARASPKGSRGLLEAARTRLTLLGQSREQIEALTRRRRVDEGLLLGGRAGSAWAYASVYSADLPYVQAGQTVFLKAADWPLPGWRGRVASIDPTVDAMTRTTRVRVKLDEAAPALRPDTYLDASIEARLGRAPALPRSAVLDTGTEQLVFVDKGGGAFEPRSVRLGRRGDDYDEVLSGVAVGESVVVNGNFLIDSESQVRGAAANVKP